MSNEYEYGFDESKADAFLDESKQFKDNSSNDGDLFTKEIWGLLDGEEITCALIGGPNEPYAYYQHNCTPIPGSADKFGTKVVCLGNGQSPAACPACAAAEGRSKSIKRAQRYGAVSLFSFRYMAKIPQAGGTVKTRPVATNRACGKTKRLEKSADGKSVQMGPRQYPEDVTFEYEGIKAWKGNADPSQGNIHSLVMLIAQQRKLCTCDATVGSAEEATPAEVVVTGYACRHCGATLPNTAQGRVTKCLACGQTGMPAEQLRCTAGCSDPRRKSVFNHYIRIRRVGSDQTTRYEFEVLKGVISEEHRALMTEVNDKGIRVPKSLDLAGLYKPNKSAMEAALLTRGYNARGIAVAPGGGLPGGGASKAGIPTAAGGDSFDGVPEDDDIPF